MLAHCDTSRWESKLQGNRAVGAVAPFGFNVGDVIHITLLTFAASEAFLALNLGHEVVHSIFSVWVRFLFKVSIARLDRIVQVFFCYIMLFLFGSAGVPRV